MSLHLFPPTLLQCFHVFQFYAWVCVCMHLKSHQILLFYAISIHWDLLICASFLLLFIPYWIFVSVWNHSLSVWRTLCSSIVGCWQILWVNIFLKTFLFSLIFSDSVILSRQLLFIQNFEDNHCIVLRVLLLLWKSHPLVLLLLFWRNFIFLLWLFFRLYFCLWL